MALVKCPECGKEKVSDSAMTCPACGYGIRVYFDKKKEKERQQRRLDSVKMPEMPEKQKLSAGQAVFTFIWLVFGVVFFIVGISSDMGGLALFYLIMGGGISGMFYYIGVIQDYNKAMEKYNKAMQDFEKYKRDEIREQDIKRAEQEKREEAKQKGKPICPKCGSTNIQEATRGYSVVTGFVGSSSPRDVCRKCGFKWKPNGWSEALQKDLNGY